MPRYCLFVRYDGTAFHGSQLQGNLPTVQRALNEALSTLLHQPISTVGGSRTDEGVHALSNAYHFDAPYFDQKLVYSLNAILPHTLSVSRIARCSADDFHARFLATSRQYRYRIYFTKDPFRYQRGYYFPYKSSFALLEQTAAELMEHRDFSAFAKRHGQSFTNLCHITESRWEDHDEEWHYVVRSNRFLRGMVRGLTGTQLRVGRGALNVAGFRAVIESHDNRRADFSVPGFGLYLEDIAYPEGSFSEIYEALRR